MSEVLLVGGKRTPGYSREEYAVSVYETSRVAGVIHCEERIGTGPPRAKTEVTNHAQRAPLRPATPNPAEWSATIICGNTCNL